MEERSVCDLIQETFIDAGIDTYLPAQKKGDCKEPYVVIKDDGAAKVLGYSSEYQYYTLLCYVPKDSYRDLMGFVKECENLMAQPPIYPRLMPTGTKTPSFYDDSFNAHMISVQYRNNVRNKHL